MARKFEYQKKYDVNVCKQEISLFNLRISREVEFIQFVHGVRNIPNRICKTATEFDKRNFTKLAVVKFRFSQISRTDVPVSRCSFVNKEINKK